MPEELRVHYHVPLCWDGQPRIASTRADLDEAFFARIREGICPHIEIETYTFDVLPDALRAQSVAEQLKREFAWVLERFAGA